MEQFLLSLILPYNPNCYRLEIESIIMSLQFFLNQDENKGMPTIQIQIVKQENYNKNMTCAKQKSNRILLQKQNKAVIRKHTQN